MSGTIRSAEIAALADVSRPTIALWRKRYDFPDPVAMIDGWDVWDRDEIIAWLRSLAEHRVTIAKQRAEQATAEATKAQAALEEAQAYSERFTRA